MYDEIDYNDEDVDICDVDDYVEDEAEELAASVMNAVLDEIEMAAAQKKLDDAVDASALSVVEKKVVKQLESALLRGSPAEISRGLRVLDDMNRRGLSDEVRNIQARVTDDFRKLNLHVTFDQSGDMTLSPGAPRFYHIDKEGGFTSRINSGQLSSQQGILELTQPIASPVQSVGAAIVGAAMLHVDEYEGKRRAEQGIRELSRQTVDRLNR
jgi:hypothetical protein